MATLKQLEKAVKGTPFKIVLGGDSVDIDSTSHILIGYGHCSTAYQDSEGYEQLIHDLEMGYEPCDGSCNSLPCDAQEAK